MLKYAQSTLDQYRAFQRKSFFKANVQASDESIYVAQLDILDQEEQRGTVDIKIVLGIFLFIYLQIDNNEETIFGSINDALGRKPCKYLRLALENCTFTLDETDHSLKNMANNFRCSMGASDLASEALQEAFLFFYSFERRVNTENYSFFTPAQQLLICHDNFLCAMLNIKQYARFENIIPSIEKPLYNLDNYFQIIKNSVMNLDKITHSLLQDYPMKDEHGAKKLACLLIVDNVYVAIKALNIPEFLPVEIFLEKIMGNFFFTKLYVQDKGQAYEALRKKFFFGVMALENTLFNEVDEKVQEFLVEWMVRSEMPASKVNFASIMQQISLSSKEEVLLKSFVERQALVESASVKKASKARAALSAYRAHLKVQIQAETRAVYEEQLACMAHKEENESATEEAVLGLFLLIILLIHSNEISQSFVMGLLRNGVASLLDSGFDEEETGSSLERILSEAQCIMSDETAPITLSVVANSCNTSFSSDMHIAFASRIIQKTFFLMWKEPISSTSRPGTFFTPDQKALAYQYSYLCAMQDIFSFSGSEKIIVELFEPDKSIVNAFLKIIENVMTCLPALSDHVAQVFPETIGEDYANLRVKLACYLVLCHIFFESKKVLCVKESLNFLEILLRRFFPTTAMMIDPMPIAEQLSKVFFSESIKSCGLFDGIEDTVCTPLLAQTSHYNGSFLKWARVNNFLPTKRDDFLIDDFLSRILPLQEVVSNVVSVATVEM